MTLTLFIIHRACSTSTSYTVRVDSGGVQRWRSHQGGGWWCLADGAGVFPAGLEVSLQQLDDDGLAEVGGSAPLPHGLAVVERLHAVLQCKQRQHNLTSAFRSHLMVWRRGAFTACCRTSDIGSVTWVKREERGRDFA